MGAMSRGSSLLSAFGGVASSNGGGGNSRGGSIKQEAPTFPKGGSSTSGGAGESTALLRKCKWLDLRGARLHTPLSAEPTYFEMTCTQSGGGGEKTNHLWAESADQKSRWVRRLLQTLQKTSFQPPPLPLPRPRCTATDQQARMRMRNRVACYAREGALLQGGWHSAVLSSDPALLTALLQKRPQRAAAAEALVGGTPLHLAVELGNVTAVEALLR